MKAGVIVVCIIVIQIGEHVALENCTAIQIGDKPAWNILRQTGHEGRGGLPPELEGNPLQL